MNYPRRSIYLTNNHKCNTCHDTGWIKESLTGVVSGTMTTVEATRGCPYCHHQTYNTVLSWANLPGITIYTI